MNYRHVYHAGNFADVIKHITLLAILEKLKNKETPFCFLDTHAGIGIYELQSEQTQKKQEYHHGIEKLIHCDEQKLPVLLKNYIQLVKQYNVGDSLTCYPGSPVVARDVMRDFDQIILCELHKEDYGYLKSNMGRSDHVAIHQMDGYLGMKAFLPPKLKRGLVMIDPPFEITNEFEKISESIARCLKHWRSGHIMVWYPIKNERAVNQFYDEIRQMRVEHMIIHFSLRAPIEAGRLSACGILLINPPFQIRESLNATLPVLSDLLNADYEVLK